MKRLFGERSTDRGFAAIWMAITFLFIVGAAAIAVDASGAYNTARTDQTTADLACLAGVKELPDTNAAINQTINYTVANWPSMAGNTPVIVGTTATYADGSGNSVAIDASYGGDPSKMHLVVNEVSDSFFSRALGSNGIPVSQEAFCRVTAQSTGGGGLPFGALPGGWQGGLQAPNPCGTNSGNCGALFIPRDDVSGTNPILIKNIAEGSDRDLTPWLGSSAGAANCSAVSAGQQCSIIKTDTGVSASALGEGMLQRLENDSVATCTTTVNGRLINCDTPAQVLGSAPTPLMAAFATQPSFWESSLNGTYNAANTTNHYYFDGIIAKCDSPRLGTIPIVSEDLNWDLGDANPGWPSGKKDVKLVGRLWVIIVDPNDSSDWQGSGNLKKASSHIIWWGPNVECAGPGGTTTPFDPDAGGLTVKTVKLVDLSN